MIKVKTYPKYKDSRLPWFGEVPSSWEIIPLIALFRERGEINKDLREDKVLSVVRDIGVIPYEQKGNIGNKKSEDIGRYKIVKPNDIVLNSMNIIIGSVGISKYEGCLSPVYYVLKNLSDDILPPYYDYVFKIKIFQQSLVRLGKGILAHRMRIPMELLKREQLPKPPLDEQKQIVAFLRVQCKKISRFIRKKRRLIELLNEQKQVIINQAVTRGIDPNVRLKPSGVDYLSDIPEHWEVRRLKYLTKGALQYGANEPAMYTNPDWPRYVRITDIKSDGNLRDDTFCSLPEDIAAPYLLNYGDILFARSGATVGKTFCYNKDWGRAAYAGYLIRARIDMKKVDPLFVSCFTNSAIYWQWISAIFIKATIQNVSAEKYASIKLPIPPLQEQYKIIEYLDEKCSKIDSAVTRAQHEIDLIREYRTRLISDVVTGKIDVRDIPVEAIEEPEKCEELDIVGETEKQEEEMEELEEVHDEDV